MSRGTRTPMLLIALGLPGAAQAFGLGDVRVSSALNEPLSAQVDIIGATSEELQALKARVADADEFRRRDADRPSYLATVTVRVATDVQGRPVLNLYSEAAFTDPVVELLLDVRWGAGQLVRDYSLLLDPAVFRPIAAQDAAPVNPTPAVTAPAPAVASTVASTVARTVSTSAVYRVRPRDTLYAIVSRAGAVTAADRQRMMIALFRDNPDAFDGNINLLHRDALLTVPTLASLATMDVAQARRDVAEHMSAWHRTTTARPAPVVIPIPAPATTTDPVPVIATDPVPQEDVAKESAAQAAPVAPPPTPQPTRRHAAERLPAPSMGFALVVALPLLGLAILVGLATLVLKRLRAARSSSPAALALQAAAGAQQPAATGTLELPAAQDTPTVLLPTGTGAAAGTDDRAAATVETTADMAINTETVILEGMVNDDTIMDVGVASPGMARATDTRLDYNLVDLDGNAQHVHMPSELNDRANFVERRTNVTDALRAAIARDPSRSDLRMKLLEAFFGAAAVNRRGFAEYVRQQAGDPDGLSADEWQKIALMGQELGLELDLPAEQSDEDDLAHCA